MDIARLESQIKQAEGIRTTAYRDSLGKWTGGVGHLLDQAKDWTGVKFTIAQISEWLESDINTAIAASSTLLEWPFLDTPARQEAVIELVFNMGLSHWKGFAHARLFITKKDWLQASAALLDSAWTKQVQPQGLDKPGRAKRLAYQLETGDFE